MDISELKERIENGEISVPGSTEEIDVGTLKSSSDELVSYSIFHGWNLVFSKECSDQWNKYNLALLEEIDAQNFTEERLGEVLESLQTEDFHWDWYAKSSVMRTDEYRWFYLYADDKPQCACVIFQPKGSELVDSNIFYIEFIAVAPWNRSNLLKERYLFDVGSTMLRAILDYSVNTLGLSPGFSLHSLPQAKGYYEKLKMVNVERLDKGSLLYFELPILEAQKLMEVL